jgi:single-strand DNA-binding protein
VAVSRRWRGDEGQLQEKVEWFRVVARGRQAEICNQYLERGSPVYIEGRIETRSFEAADGNLRSLTELVARDVVILPRGNGEAAIPDGIALEEE